jgi:hypothetical protein
MEGFRYRGCPEPLRSSAELPKRKELLLIFLELPNLSTTCFREWSGEEGLRIGS